MLTNGYHLRTSPPWASRVLAGVALLTMLGLGGCQQAPPRAVAPAAPPAPETTPLGPGATHYRVSADRSDVRILVFRAGPLARFGHNHVIRAATVSGDVYLDQDFPRSRFALTLRVPDFQVDPPALRAVEGEDFATQPSAQAIAGTLDNLLGPKVLDAEQFPEIRIRSLKLVGPEWGPDLTMAVEIRDVTREQTVPVALERSEDSLVVTGIFTLEQSEFGITPFSVLAGGLQVQDAVKLRLRIVAERVS